MNKVKELLKVHGKPSREVYFDHENSGWVPPEVVEAMLPYFNKKGYGHPAITNKPGWEAYEVLEETIQVLSETLNVNEGGEFIFTHSGTEANNLAIMGTAFAHKGGDRRKIVVTAIEHPSVLYPAQELEKFGFKTVVVPVDDEGFVDPEILMAYIDDETLLVSVQMVNHEIGTIQNLGELVEVVKNVDSRIVFHTDAVDAYGRVPIDIKELGVDLMTISSHKIHGPKGVGVLYKRDGVKIKRIIHGTLSTQVYWPGVENIPAIAGFKKAIELAFNDFENNIKRMKQLRDLLFDEILNNIDDVVVNGPLGDERAPDNVNVSFLHVEGEALTVELSLRGIYVSSGSACTSRVLEPSHVLLAIGRAHEEAHGSILFKVTRYHTRDDVKYAVEQLKDAVSKLRAMSPLTVR